MKRNAWITSYFAWCYIIIVLFIKYLMKKREKSSDAIFNTHHDGGNPPLNHIILMYPGNRYVPVALIFDMKNDF